MKKIFKLLQWINCSFSHILFFVHVKMKVEISSAALHVQGSQMWMENLEKSYFKTSHFACATKRKPFLPLSPSISVPPAPLCPLHPSSSFHSSSPFSYLRPPHLLLWDHGNCASSVAFHALPAALQKEACSNDLLHSSLAIIALTINSRLAFLCGGGGGGDVSVGSLIRAPCNVSGSSSHPATSALALLPLLGLLL